MTVAITIVNCPMGSNSVLYHYNCAPFPTPKILDMLLKSYMKSYIMYIKF